MGEGLGSQLISMTPPFGKDMGGAISPLSIAVCLTACPRTNLGTTPGLGSIPAITTLAGLPVISSFATAPHLPSASLSAYSRLGSAAMTVASTRAAPLPATSAPLHSATAGSFPGPTLLNLLPLAPTHLSPQGAGVYIGEGQPPVPSKLAKKIKRWVHVEMSELLPVFWSRQKEGENKQVAPRRGRQVTEIFTWVQCFCTYTSVLSGSSPVAVPELLAYLVTIIRVSQDYTGLAWVRYDSSFRR